MSDLTVHNIHVSYDESDERVRNFVKYLKEEERKEEMKGYYREAIHSPDGRVYLSDKNGKDFTLICNVGYNCALGLRGK